MTVVDTLAGIITAIFLLVVLSYYALLFIRVRKPDYHKFFKSITIIIPARNEERYIADCIRSIIAAKFDGKKEIIIVDDASKDTTSRIAKQFKGVIVLRNSKHSGKSYSINRALRQAKGDLIAIVDGDSVISKGSLAELAREVARKDVAGASSVVKVKNRTSFINPWVQLELLYSSFIRGILSKVNANVVTPGALSVYRKDALLSIGGFSTDGFSEDMDVAVRLIRKGYRIGFSETAVSETNMPDTPKAFFRQRTRISRGLINIFKKHLQVNAALIDVYTMPLFLFSYAQAIIMGAITVYKIVSGYITYFAAKGVFFSWGVVKFFIEWLSIVGFVRWTWNVFTGVEALTIVSIIGITVTFLTYPLYLYAILKYDKKFDWLHLVPLVFMFPYWLLIMGIYTICLPEILMRKQYNRWKKNE